MCLSITYRIKDGIKSVGIAYIDSVERRLGVTEFVENDIFSNTEVGFWCIASLYIHDLTTTCIVCSYRVYSSSSV